MTLLPKTAGEFQDPAYWQKFFKSRDTPFEWYGDFAQLGRVLEKYLKTSDKLYQPGCGNSRLAEQLWDNGYRNVKSVDNVDEVIRKQKQRNVQLRPELMFDVADATDTSYDSGSFTAIVDKGTLDALCPPEMSADSVQLVDKYLCENWRLLSNGGRYVTVTLAQAHVLQAWLNVFTCTNAILRVHQLERCAAGSTNDGGDASFPMPIFLLIATKLKAGVTMPKLYEFCCASEKPRRITEVKALTERVQASQEYSWFCYQCHMSTFKRSCPRMTLNDERGRPRYELAIVDHEHKATLHSYAIMIVPQGRETEWLFATDKGCHTVRQQAMVDRLALVTLCRAQNYVGGMDAVKTEIGQYAADFAPSGLTNRQIPCLSIGDDLGRKETIEKGRSELNGDYIVEDILPETADGSTPALRRLVFLSNQNLIQSEAYLIAQPDCSSPATVDHDRLACDHHRGMIAAVALASTRFDADVDYGSFQCRMLILGLGAGSLASYLAKMFSTAVVTGVEIDPVVVKVAEKWFGFRSTAKCQAVIEDGLLYLQTAHTNSETFDCIFMDVAGPMHSDGLSCPLPAFLTNDCLATVKSLLESTGGWLALNLVTRDEEKATEVKSALRQHFPTIICQRSDTDINQVLLCSPVDVATDRVDFVKRAKRRLRLLAEHLLTSALSDRNVADSVADIGTHLTKLIIK